jgi:hypothetical protein
MDARPWRWSANSELLLSASLKRKISSPNFPYFEVDKELCKHSTRGTLHVNPWDYVISSICGLFCSLARCCHRSTTLRSHRGIAMRNANYVPGNLVENERLPRGQPARNCGPGHRGRHRYHRRCDDPRIQILVSSSFRSGSSLTQMDSNKKTVEPC